MGTAPQWTDLILRPAISIQDGRLYSLIGHRATAETLAQSSDIILWISVNNQGLCASWLVREVGRTSGM
jgi:hypothetical protein